jgi:DNA repair exonuclease SbcCD nuclease subunit
MTRPFSFLHTGDLHLDTPFTGMTGAVPPEVSRRLREATLKAWSRIVDIALERHVDFVVVAGDVFESETRTLRGQLAFADGLDRLARAGIPTAVVTGNHDPLSGWEATVTWPSLAHRFGADAPSSLPIVRDGEEIARVHGMSYARKAETRDLAALFARDPGSPFAIGLLHGTVGLNERHERYAPTTTYVLVASGMDYWALGHIHRRRIERAARPTVVYPGNPQGRDPGEAEAKGVAIVTVGADGSGQAAPQVEWVDTDVVRWTVTTIDCAPVPSISDLRAAIRDRLAAARTAAGRSIVVRVVLRGFTPLHDELRMRGVADDLLASLRDDHPLDGAEITWLEAIRDETRSDRETAYARGADFVAELEALIEASRTGEAGAGHAPLDLGAIASDLYDDHRMKAVFEADAPAAPPAIDGILDQARSLVLDRLRSTGA